MAASIFTRATGAALYLGAIGLAVWLAALSAGPQAFALADAFFQSLIGQLALYAMTLSVCYHLAAGLRHLFWDMGRGHEPKIANATAWLAFVFCLAGPIGIWALANL
jgi:succinate dehydrogenase / fumarate reductase cytochrome b subunit